MSQNPTATGTGSLYAIAHAYYFAVDVAHIIRHPVAVSYARRDSYGHPLAVCLGFAKFIGITQPITVGHWIAIHIPEHHALSLRYSINISDCEYERLFFRERKSGRISIAVTLQ